MIHPRLGAPVAPHATMLVYLFTDIEAESAQLRELLPQAVEKSFNSISIDGDTSTNDTVLLLASGASGLRLDERSQKSFSDALAEVCNKLAYAIVDDGEGVTHVVTLHITGARSEFEAKQIAKSIAHSPLCKTAWSSADPNWGRLMAAAGYSGVEFDPEKVTKYGSARSRCTKPECVLRLSMKPGPMQRCSRGITRSRSIWDRARGSAAS